MKKIFNTSKVCLKSYYSLGWECLFINLSIDSNGKKFPNTFGLKWKSTKITPQQEIRRITDKKLQRKINSIAIKTGQCSNLFVLDLDIGEEKNGLEKIKELKIKIPDNTVCVETPSGGRHYYFTLPEELKDITTGANLFEKNSGIDFRANGGLIFAPPSRVAGGGLYKWIIPPFKTERKRPPEKLIKMILSEYEKKNQVTQRFDSNNKKGVFSQISDFMQVTRATITEKQKLTFFNLLNECAIAKKGQRSELDFKMLNYGIKIGYFKEELWKFCNDISKFKEKRRPYFEQTYDNALKAL